MSLKLIYLFGIFKRTLLYYNATNRSSSKSFRPRSSIEIFSVVIYTQNVSNILSKVTLTNSYLLNISNCLAVDIASTAVYTYQDSFFTLNFTFTLLKARTDIIRTIFILMSTSKMICSKNYIFQKLFQIEMPAKTISQVLRKVLSIFWVSIFLVFQISLRVIANTGFIILLLLLKLIRSLA